METKTLKRTGWILILFGLVGLGITAAQMMTVMSADTIGSASFLSDSISGTLVPATIGALFALAGVIMVSFGWWRRRLRKQRVAFKSAA